MKLGLQWNSDGSKAWIMDIEHVYDGGSVGPHELYELCFEDLEVYEKDDFVQTTREIIKKCNGLILLGIL